MFYALDLGRALHARGALPKKTCVFSAQRAH